MNKLYFAYGANMHPENMRYRCPDAHPVSTLFLKDWQLQFYSHATIEPKKGAVTPGVLWSITEYCELALDRFEGFPYYYTKSTWRQGNQEFFFYEMAGNKIGRPSTCYIEDIEDSYDYWRLPVGLLEDALPEQLCY